MALLRKAVGALKPHPVVLDIGANIGITSIVLAAEAAKIGGYVVAFEPQRILFQMLCGNLAINSIDNVIAHQMAVGASNGSIQVPQLNYYQPASFGSLEIGALQSENIGQTPDKNRSSETVPLITLDGLGLRRLDLVKIDVEGMELAVLAGAKNTIAAQRPILLIEWIKNDPIALKTTLEQMGYLVAQAGQNFICTPIAA